MHWLPIALTILWQKAYLDRPVCFCTIVHLNDEVTYETWIDNTNDSDVEENAGSFYRDPMPTVPVRIEQLLALKSALIDYTDRFCAAVE